MGCCHTKHVLRLPVSNTARQVSDLASRIAIDLISIYSDNTQTPIDIYRDERQYLFGRRVINTVIADNRQRIPVYTLRYMVPFINFALDECLLTHNSTPLDLLKEYLAMHNLSYPVDIKYIMHDTNGFYEITLEFHQA